MAESCVNSHPPARKIRRTRLTANCQQFKTLFPRCATQFQRSKHRLGVFLLTFILHFKSETSSSTSLAPHIDSFAPRPHARAHTHAWEYALRHLFLHISEWGTEKINEQIQRCRCRRERWGGGQKSLAAVADSVKQARHLTACSKMTPRAVNAWIRHQCGKHVSTERQNVYRERTAQQNYNYSF